MLRTARLSACLLTAFALIPLTSSCSRSVVQAASAMSPGAHLQSVQRVRLTILHTNDTHGHLLPYSYPDTYDPNSDLGKLEFRHNIGGAARRATLVKRIRAQKTHQTLLIDAGDICDGTPFSTEYHGDADVAAMNAIGYDLACPGNHEYNNKLAQVHKLISEAKFPYVSANTTEAGKPLYTPYVIKNIGGAKVAFFGLLTYSAHTYPAAKEGLAMEPPIEVAKRVVPVLRKQADLVVAVTHDGVDEDQQMAREVPGIDVIVGGHSHTLLAQPLFIPSHGSGNPHSVNGTIIVQDFQWAGTLGRLDLLLYRDEQGRWSVERYLGHLIPVTSSVPEDPAVAKVVAGYWQPIAAKYGKVVGTATDDFSEKGVDYAEYNLVADAVREQTGAEFDLENMGGVRAPLTRGPITYGDMVTMDPFGNTVVTFDMTGRNLRKFLLAAHPAVSNIRYLVDGDKLIEATIGGEPILDDRVYHGATNSYFISQPVFKGLVTNVVDTRKDRLSLVLRYLDEHGPIAPLYDGRRILRHVQETD